MSEASESKDLQSLEVVSRKSESPIISSIKDAVIGDDLLVEFVDNHPEIAAALLKEAFLGMHLEMLQEEKQRQRRLVRMMLRGAFHPGSAATAADIPPTVKRQLETRGSGKRDQLQNTKRQSRTPERYEDS